MINRLNLRYYGSVDYFGLQLGWLGH